MAAIQNAAYAASAELAAEKGAFPLFDAERFLASPNVALLDEEVREAIRRHGMRNGCLTSIAPTGTISLLAGNVSSGIEPVFDYHYTRRLLAKDGTTHEQTVEDYAHARFRRQFGAQAPLPDTFVRAADLTPAEHLAMQAAVQPYVDSAISKTINCPKDIAFEDFKGIYLEAYGLGLKGCTTYRPNPITGAVLTPVAEPEPSPSRQRPSRRDRRSPRSLARPKGPLSERAKGRVSSTWRPRSSARVCWPATPTSSNGRAVRPRHLRHHQRYRARRAPAAVRDLHQHPQPRALRLDGRA